MMVEKIGRAAMLEQLAEECAELGQAALKMARIMRGKNPTPISMGEAEERLKEEYTDVRTCAKELGLQYDLDIENRKQKRFLNRWEGFTHCPKCGYDAKKKFTSCPACGYQAEE